MLLCLKLCDNGLFSKMLTHIFVPLILLAAAAVLHAASAFKYLSETRSNKKRKKKNRRINEILQGKSLYIFFYNIK